MHKVCAFIMSSTLALSSSVALAANGENKHSGNCLGSLNSMDSIYISTNVDELEQNQLNHQRHFLDGLNLTADQRQQLRDLIRQKYRDVMPKMYMDNMEAMHQLIIADRFNEENARVQAELIAKAQVERQVALVKLNHQFYRLLTAEQKAIFNQNHLERMQKMQQHLDKMRKYEEPNPQ